MSKKKVLEKHNANNVMYVIVKREGGENYRRGGRKGKTDKRKGVERREGTGKGKKRRGNRRKERIGKDRKERRQKDRKGKYKKG